MEILPAFELENRLVHLDNLVADLASGRFRRTTFQPWEVEFLLDLHVADGPFCYSPITWPNAIGEPRSTATTLLTSSCWNTRTMSYPDS